MSEKDNCSICDILGAKWEFTMDPGYEDEGTPLPPEAKQLLVMKEAEHRKNEEETSSGIWFKDCPECGRQYKYVKSLTYCIHYCIEFEGLYQVDYLEVFRQVEETANKDIPSLLQKLEQSYSRYELILYLNCILEGQQYHVKDKALELLSKIKGETEPN